MKLTKTVLKSIALLGTLSILAFVAAATSTNQVVKEVENVLDNSFVVEIQALLDNKDVTTKSDIETAILFVFDSNNNFLKQVHINKATLLLRKEYKLQFPNQQSLKIVAFAGNSRELDAQVIEKGNSFICNLQMNLIAGRALNQDISDELFVGNAELISSAKSKKEKTNRIQVVKQGKTKNADQLLAALPNANICTKDDIQTNVNKQEEKDSFNNSYTLAESKVFDLTNEIVPL